jgi:hypothetical protein
VFVVVGIVVNAGGNTSHEYIGGKNWRVGDAPFVGGFAGSARVFVTASFACECQQPFVRTAALALIVCSYRWRNRESGDHCRRDQEPVQEHA